MGNDRPGGEVSSWSIVNRHFKLLDDSVLSFAVELNPPFRTVRYGWALCRPEEKQWIRKVANQIAEDRLYGGCLHFTLQDYEPMTNHWINYRVLLHFVQAIIIGHKNLDKLPVMRKAVIVNKMSECFEVVLEKEGL